jgi:hypothetical protein
MDGSALPYLHYTDVEECWLKKILFLPKAMNKDLILHGKRELYSLDAENIFHWF